MSKMSKMSAVSDLSGVMGTVDSFRGGTGKGKQEFSNVKIRSGATIQNPDSVPLTAFGGTVRSFVRDGDGDQIFTGGEIVTGVVKETKERGGTHQNLWRDLEKIGVEKDSVLPVYMHFVKNPKDVPAFYAVPINKRKQMLSFLLPNYSPMGSNRTVNII